MSAPRPFGSEELPQYARCTACGEPLQPRSVRAKVWDDKSPVSRVNLGTGRVTAKRPIVVSCANKKCVQFEHPYITDEPVHQHKAAAVDDIARTDQRCTVCGALLVEP